MNDTKQALEAVAALVGAWMRSGGTDDDAYQEGCEQAFKLIRQHGPQLAKALEDARRYRWLRDIGSRQAWCVSRDIRGGGVYQYDDDGLDAAIDAAMAALNGDEL